MPYVRVLCFPNVLSIWEALPHNCYRAVALCAPYNTQWGMKASSKQVQPKLYTYRYSQFDTLTGQLA